MAKITICNMTATRRRSASDLFLENGIWILRQYLADKGHTVEPLDLAKNSFFNRINGGVIARLNRFFYGKLFTGANPKNTTGKRIIGGLTLLLQSWHRRTRRKRMHRELLTVARNTAAQKAPIFGIKVWYGEAYYWAETLARMIRDLSPQTVLIAGGYHPNLYREQFMEASNFDLAVTGEGEIPLQIILDAVDRYADNWDPEALLKEIRNRVAEGSLKNTIIRKDGASTDYLHHRSHPEILNKAVPRFHLEDNEKMRVHILIDSLGCAWGKCHFCVHSSFFEKMAPRRFDLIVDEISEMVDQGIGLFRFSGSDTFPAFGARIGAEILKRGLKIQYGIGARATVGAEDHHRFAELTEQYETMIKSGLRAVFMGGETGNDWINEHVMNKGVTADDIAATIAALRAAEKRTGEKVYVSLALIYPCPTLGKVSLETIFDDNIALVQRTRPDAVMVTPPCPFKPSKWYRERETFGFSLSEDFFNQLMVYEYVLYKPLHLWDDLGLILEDMDFREIIALTGKMRAAVEAMGIPTDLSDEHFLMQIASGYAENPGQFKRQSLLDIISGDYRWLEEIGKQVNRYSAALAAKNKS